MIWADGAILDDQALRIGLDDRVFEHGLGLFETFRTWQGRAVLLNRHLGRLRRSAKRLGLSVEGVRFPVAKDVTDLLTANRDGLDARLRLTMTGGLGGSGGSSLWMRSAAFSALPTAAESPIDFGPWEVLESDMLARHKSLNYWSRRRAHETAVKRGLVEILSHGAGDRLWEGSRTNLFGIEGVTLQTPSVEGPIVPGIFRGLVIEAARTLGFLVEEPHGMSLERLAACSEVFLTNSVRGIVPVSRCRDLIWPTPGESTLRIQETLKTWIETAIRERKEL